MDLTTKYQRDRIYEKLAKPGNDFSVYSNKHYLDEILLDKYQVNQIFQDKSSGFYALGLVSTTLDNSPVLVIRGFGNWGAFEDFPREFFPYHDIPDVVINQSNEHFQAAQKLGVIKWLQQQTMVGAKPDIVGQSLGGKVGQQLAIEVPEYVNCLVTFNSIGISSTEFKQYQGNVEICHYLNPADLVPYVLGEKFLPGTILQVCNPSIKKPDLLGQHNKLVLDNPVTLIQEGDIEKFYRIRELYKTIIEYSKALQNEVEKLQQIDKRIISKSNLYFIKDFDSFNEIIQNKFKQLIQDIQQDLLQEIAGKSSKTLLKKQVQLTVEFVQKQIEQLSQTIYKKNNNTSADQSLDNFRKKLSQKFKDALVTTQQKLDDWKI